MNLCLLAVIALEVTISRTFLVQLEVVAVTVAVLGWDLWALFQILGRVCSNWWARDR